MTMLKSVNHKMVCLFVCLPVDYSWIYHGVLFSVTCTHTRCYAISPFSCTDQQWLCDPSSIRFGESIGEGQFGDVFRGILNTEKVSSWCYDVTIQPRPLYPYSMVSNQLPSRLASRTPPRTRGTSSYKKQVSVIYELKYLTWPIINWKQEATAKLTAILHVGVAILRIN